MFDNRKLLYNICNVPNMLYKQSGVNRAEKAVKLRHNSIHHI